VERGEFVVEVLPADDDRRRQRQPLAPLSTSQLTGALTEETRSSIGRWGEEFVCRYLEDSVPVGQRVVWLNRSAESGECYDLVIEDVATAEVMAYVEVKTSKAADKMLFEVSHHEWTFAQMRGDSFHFYRCVASAGSVRTHTPHARQPVYVYVACFSGRFGRSQARLRDPSLVVTLHRTPS